MPRRSIVSGQPLTEDYYVVNKLTKGFLGTNNVDSNSRLCMSSAVMGYKGAFGTDGPPTAYSDIGYAARVHARGAPPGVLGARGARTTGPPLPWVFRAEARLLEALRRPGAGRGPGRGRYREEKGAELQIKIRLTRTVRNFGGSPFPKGAMFEARVARDGMLEVIGAQHLPLYPHEWELVLTDEELGRLLLEDG